MRIGELATQADVPTKTIRFWEQRGLVPEPRRTPAGYRDYERAVVDRLAFIRQAQVAGFTLDQIRQVLAISDDGEPACEHVATLISKHLDDVENRLRELHRTRDELRSLVHRAKSQDPSDCHGYCVIIAGIDDS